MPDFHGDVVETDADNLHPFAVVQESDPGAIGPGKGWFKRSTRELKTRNAADSGWDPAYPSGSLLVVIDGGGSAISTGVKTDLTIPFAGVVESWTLLADQSGSIVVDIWKDTYANYPPTVADTITASAKPTLSSATKNTDSTLTGWTTSFAAGDTFRFNVDSATTVTRVTLALTVRRS